MISESDTMRPADLADTGLWRLIIMLSDNGAQAWLRPTSDLSLEPKLLFEKSWEPTSEADILRNIENVIYDNPRVLDDYSTHMIINTRYAMWVPAQFSETNMDSDAEFFNEVYPQLAEEMLVDEYHNMHCLYALTPGLISFLQRTFPGARINCQQTVLLSRFAERADEHPHIYIHIHDSGVDYIGIHEQELLFASSSSDTEKNNIIYNVINAVNAYDLPADKTHIFMSGNKDIRREIAPELRKFVAFVMPAMVPRLTMPKTMPLPILFSATQSRQRNNFPL